MMDNNAFAMSIPGDCVIQIDNNLIHYYNRNFRNRYNIEKITDCGIILLCKDLEHILLVKQVESNKWGLPKGHMEFEKDGNNKFKCARRELEEETGIRLQTGKYTKIGSLVINNKLLYIICLTEDYTKVKLSPDVREIINVYWARVSDIIEEFIRNQPCNRTLKEFVKLCVMHHKYKSKTNIQSNDWITVKNKNNRCKQQQDNWSRSVSTSIS
jgi:8-oxo-dGTP pyrophosphatase MutT (NUDIX family)